MTVTLPHDEHGVDIDLDIGLRTDPVAPVVGYRGGDMSLPALPGLGLAAEMTR